MSRGLFAAGTLFWLWAGLCCGAGVDPLTVFTQPTGIAIDPTGQLYIVSAEGGQPAITRTTPSLARVYTVPLAGVEAGEGPGRLAWDRTLSMLWYLSPNGRLFFVNPALGTSVLLADLRTLPFDAGKTVDVGQGTMQPFSGQLQTQKATWGDISVLWQKTDPPGLEGAIFMTGLSAGIPFVARISLAFTVSEQKVQTGIIAAEVVMASQAPGAGMTAPTGIAIDEELGIVLTTLPVADPSGGAAKEQFIYFPTDLNIRQGALVRFSGLTISSRGMAADQHDRAVIATGPAGGHVCTVPGAIVYLDLQSGDTRCSSNPPGSGPQDVAVDPTSNTAWVTLGPDNFILSFPLPSPGQSPASPGSAAARR